MPGTRGFTGSFSPDGNWVVFGEYGRGDLGVRALNVLTGESHRILRGGYAMPVWSPDGRWLAIDWRAGSPMEVWIAEAAPFLEMRTCRRR
jgi:Tol biopolymer transport system component